MTRQTPRLGRRTLGTFSVKGHMIANVAVGGGNVAGLLLGVLTGALTARALGPTLRGEVAAVQTWAGAAAVLLTGGVTQAIVTYRGDDKDIAKPLMLQAAIATLVGLGLFATIRAAGHGALASWLAVGGGTLLVAGGVVSSNNAGLAQRQSRMAGRFQLVRLAPQAAAAFVVIALWLQHNRSPGVWLLLLGSATAVSSFVFAFQMFAKGNLGRSSRWTPPRDLVVRARQAFVLVVGSQVIYQLDRIVVASRMESQSVGYYAVSTAAAGACAVVGQSVGMVTFSRLRSLDDVHAQRALVRRGVISALAITSCLAAGLIFMAPLLIRLLYGPDFLPATLATQVLLVSAVPLAADYLLVHAALSVGASWYAFRIQALAGSLTVVLLAYATSSRNLALVSSVSVVAYSLSAAMLYRVVTKTAVAPLSTRRK